MEKYRIDYAYEKIYVYDLEDKSYYFFGTFYTLGINNKMRESQIFDIIRTEEIEVDIDQDVMHDLVFGDSE